MQRLLIRNLQLHAAVDDIALQPVQTDDFLISAAVAEILLGDCPEGVTMHHGVDAVILGGFRACHGKCRGFDRRHDGVPAGFILVDDRTITADLIDIPTQFAHPGRDSFTAVVGAAGDGHKIAHFHRTGGRLRGLCGFCLSTQLRRDLLGKVTHAGVHPVTGAAFVRKPPMDGQNHLVGFRGVVQRLGLISKPEQLRLAVALADVGAKLDESLVHHILESIRLGIVAGALNGDGSLVVSCGGGAPRAVFLLHIHSDPPVDTDAVVAACLP